MKEAIAFIPVIAFVLGLLSSLAGLAVYFSNSVRKKYAAEREFSHIKANQVAIIQLLEQIDSELGEVRAELIRLASKSD